MHKHHTDSPADNVKQRDLCFTRQHLDMDEVAYHEYALAVSRRTGIFYRDDRRDAAEFCTSKSRICRKAQAVEKKGFMVLVEPRKRMQSGIFTSSKYRVLTHDEWAAVHPGECRACPNDGTGFKARQSQDQGSPVPLVNSPVPPVVLTCPTSGTKTVYLDGEEEKEKKDFACPKDGTGLRPPLSPSANPAAVAAIGQNHPVSERAIRLAALVVETAVGIDARAVIYEGKQKTLERLLDGSDFTEDEVRGFTEDTIKALDSFGLKNAGSALVATLTARIRQRRKALAEQRRDQERMARQRAEMARQAELTLAEEKPDDPSLIEWELPQEDLEPVAPAEAAA